MIDVAVTNHAPDADAVTVRVEEPRPHFSADPTVAILVNVWREEDGTVSVTVEDTAGEMRHELTLGNPSETTKL